MYQVAPGVVSRVVGEETVIVDLDTERYFSLNSSGATVWLRVSEGAAIDSAAAELAEKYGVDREQSAADVAEIVDAFLKAGLILPVA